MPRRATSRHRAAFFGFCSCCAIIFRLGDMKKMKIESLLAELWQPVCRLSNLLPHLTGNVEAIQYHES